MLALCFIFFNLFLMINGKYVCTENATVALDFNEIAFFETPDFPALITKEEYFSCFLTFTLKQQNQTNYRLIFANTKVKYYPGVSYIDASYITSFKIYDSRDLVFPDYIDTSLYYSEQGFVLIDDGTDNCPLESLSNPFVFKDETQTIYLGINQILYNLSESCEWKFVAPNGYGFKIVIMEMNSATDLLVTNSTDTIVNTRSLKLKHPYYNDDSVIQINWFNLPIGIGSAPEDNGISASVSIVKKKFEYTDGNCTIVNVNNNTIQWTNNYFPYTGSQNNVQCSYNLSIPTNTTIVMRFMAWGLEENVDFIQYSRSKTDIVQMPLPFGQYGTDIGVLIEQNYDGFDKNVFFEFKTDGSISSLGFTLQFEFKECECNEIVKCTDSLSKDQSIMGTDGYYCGNLHCNITIEPCNAEYGIMTLYISVIINETLLFDIFRIISNDKTVLKIDNSNRQLNIYYVYLKSSNINLLEAITYPTFKPNYFSYTYKSFNLPTSNFHFSLTSSHPYVILDFRKHNLPVAEISDNLKSRNLTLWIYRFRIDVIGFSIFNNQTLAYNLNGGKDCFEKPFLYKCEIKSKEIALIEAKTDYKEFVAVRLSETFDGCIFSETMFTSVNLANITGIANSKGSCDIIISTEQEDFYHYLKFVWTTATKENVKVFIGLDKTRLYFEFNALSAERWQNVGIFSRVYIIEIPKNSALFLQIQSTIDYLSGIPVEFPHISMTTTFNFAISKSSQNNINDLSGMSVYTTGKNATLKFTALYYSISPTAIFYFKTLDISNKTITNTVYINKTGDFVIFQNKYIEIYYNPIFNSDEAMFFIEAISSSAMSIFQ